MHTIYKLKLNTVKNKANSGKLLEQMHWDTDSNKLHVIVRGIFRSD